MAISDHHFYSEISQDWRHRDNLTWQIPVILFAVTAAIFAAAFKLSEPALNSCAFLLPYLYFVGFLVSLAFNVMLIQNLLYQLGSDYALQKLEQTASIETSNLVSQRMIYPIFKKNWKKLFSHLTGSSMLLLISIFIMIFFIVISINSYVYSMVSSDLNQCVLFVVV